MSQPSDPPFGELLRRFRIKAGLSQEQLAENGGISVAAVSALERGIRRAPYRGTLDLLARALQLDDRDAAQFVAVAERARRRGPRSIAAADQPLVRNVPVPVTSFIGRSDDIAAIIELLGAHRLVTITGSGGVGKTRVALASVAALSEDDWRDVRFVDLAPINDPSYLIGTIAGSLSLSASVESLADLVAWLRGRDVLLILDNAEHLIDDLAPIVATLLRECAGVHALVTSRERLAIAGEATYRLPSLDIATASALFLERARSATPGFTIADDAGRRLANICHELDGIPLAIELAAVRAPAFGLRLLEEQLATGRVNFSGPRDVPARQRTMMATVAWSYDLLGRDEQRVLERLSLFVGGARFEALAAVCSDDALDEATLLSMISALVDKSLVSASSGPLPRFTLLESVRIFALDRLAAASDMTTMRRRHARALAEFADRIDITRMSIGDQHLQREVHPELQNARVALEWSFGTGSIDDALLGARIIGGLRTIWLTTDRMAECRTWAELALEHLDVEGHPDIAARIARLLVQSATPQDIPRIMERVTPILERAGDVTGLGLAFAHVAHLREQEGALQEADAALGRAETIFARPDADRRMPYVAFLQYRILVSLALGRFASVEHDITTARAICRQLGDPGLRLSFLEASLLFAQGEPARAARLLESALTHAEAGGLLPRDRPHYYCELAQFRLACGDVPGAANAVQTSLHLSKVEQHPRILDQIIETFALLAARRGNLRACAQLRAYSRTLRRYPTSSIVHGGPTQPSTREQLERVLSTVPPDDLARWEAEGTTLSIDEASDLALNVER